MFGVLPERPVVNCENNLMITWRANWVISAAFWATKSIKTNIKLYVPVVAIPIQDNVKLLQQLKPLNPSIKIS